VIFLSYVKLPEGNWMISQFPMFLKFFPSISGVQSCPQLRDGLDQLLCRAAVGLERRVPVARPGGRQERDAAQLGEQRRGEVGVGTEDRTSQAGHSNHGKTIRKR